MKIKAVEITEIEYGKYGILYNLSGKGEHTMNTNHSSGVGWQDVDTDRPILDTQGALGCTQGTGTPFIATEMEHHAHTQEALLPMGQPIVFCVALAGESVPKGSDVVPVILRPGYVFVLHRGTWHSSGHGLYGETTYYWQALVYENEPTVWKDIAGGSIEVLPPEVV